MKETADLVTFTEEIHSGKRHLLRSDFCAEYKMSYIVVCIRVFQQFFKGFCNNLKFSKIFFQFSAPGVSLGLKDFKK